MTTVEKKIAQISFNANCPLQVHADKKFAYLPAKNWCARKITIDSIRLVWLYSMQFYCDLSLTITICDRSTGLTTNDKSNGVGLASHRSRLWNQNQQHVTFAAHESGSRMQRCSRKRTKNGVYFNIFAYIYNVYKFENEKLMDFVESEYFDEQIRSINELTALIATYTKMSSPIGEYLMDQEMLKRFEKKWKSLNQSAGRIHTHIPIHTAWPMNWTFRESSPQSEQRKQYE